MECEKKKKKKKKKKAEYCISNKGSSGVLITTDWPPQSPDLNITGCVWDCLNWEKQKMQPTSKSELWRHVSSVWTDIVNTN